MIEHDFDEDFVPIAAELQRLPYMSPSRDFADRVISQIDRLQSARTSRESRSLAPRNRLELHQGGQQAVVPRRPMTVARATGKAVAGVALLATAAFLFFEVDVLTAILSGAAAQYSFAIAAIGAQVGSMILGPETIAYLQAGAVQGVLLYLTLLVGLAGGYSAIRTAAHIAKRKAA
jgi:hypothetical protein